MIQTKSVHLFTCASRHSSWSQLSTLKKCQGSHASSSRQESNSTVKSYAAVRDKTKQRPKRLVQNLLSIELLLNFILTFSKMKGHPLIIKKSLVYHLSQKLNNFLKVRRKSRRISKHNSLSNK